MKTYNLSLGFWGFILIILLIGSNLLEITSISYTILLSPIWVPLMLTAIFAISFIIIIIVVAIILMIAVPVEWLSFKIRKQRKY